MLKKPNRIAKGIYFTTQENISQVVFVLHYYYYFFLSFLSFLFCYIEKKLCEKPIILAMSYSCVLFRRPFFSLFPYDIRAQRTKIERKKKSEKSGDYGF